MFNWNKKEAPLKALAGMGGGVGRGGGSTFSATGGATYEPGNGFKYHLFIGSTPEQFSVESGESEVEYLVVGGGGSGGYDRNGGGGAGGLRCNSPTCPAPRRAPSLTLSAGDSYTVTVGPGGAQVGSTWGPGNNGSDSSIGTLVVATGGGSGAWTTEANKSGGSGGGAGSGGYPGRGATVASPDGISPTVQGYNGGGSTGTQTPNSGSWGGGGAGESGFGPQPNHTGHGGNGLEIPGFAGPLFPGMPTAWRTSAVGPAGFYAGGGGGGGSSDGNGHPTGGTGGQGGGGNGGTGNGATGGAGTANTGGGGGGGNNIPQGDGGAGGSGVVIIRYAA